MNWTHVIGNQTKLFQKQLATWKTNDQLTGGKKSIQTLSCLSLSTSPPPVLGIQTSSSSSSSPCGVPRASVSTCEDSFMFLHVFSQLLGLCHSPKLFGDVFPKIPPKAGHVFFLVFFSKKGGLSHDKPGSFWSPLPRHDLDHTWSWGLCQDDKPMGLDS